MRERERNVICSFPNRSSIGGLECGFLFLACLVERKTPSSKERERRESEASPLSVSCASSPKGQMSIIIRVKSALNQVFLYHVSSWFLRTTLTASHTLVLSERICDIHARLLRSVVRLESERFAVYLRVRERSLVVVAVSRDYFIPDIAPSLHCVFFSFLFFSFLFCSFSFPWVSARTRTQTQFMSFRPVRSARVGKWEGGKEGMARWVKGAFFHPCARASYETAHSVSAVGAYANMFEVV